MQSDDAWACLRSEVRGESDRSQTTLLPPYYYHPTTTLLPPYYHPTTTLLPPYYHPTTTLLPPYCHPTTALLVRWHAPTEAAGPLRVSAQPCMSYTYPGSRLGAVWRCQPRSRSCHHSAPSSCGAAAASAWQRPSCSACSVASRGRDLQSPHNAARFKRGRAHGGAQAGS